MPVASGSIAYLGAARFQGYWNATSNAATGSGLAEAASGPFSTLLISGGYHSSTNLTASAGDYWQVTGSGTTSVDGQTDWNLNDWAIYSGSAGGSGTWKKLAFEDTIASIILGDLSSSSFHMGVENDKHVIFDSGSVHSGSSNFVFDYDTNKVSITGALGVTGNTALTGNLHLSGDMFTSASIMSIVHGNPSLVSVSTTIPNGYNARMYGPITIATGKTLHVEGDSVLQITDVS
tara:strand:- start:797 stop:1498 length:702 start_codon:yes stop_codon:yes gene_type:complete